MESWASDPPLSEGEPHGQEPLNMDEWEEVASSRGRSYADTVGQGTFEVSDASEVDFEEEEEGEEEEEEDHADDNPEVVVGSAATAGAQGDSNQEPLVEHTASYSQVRVAEGATTAE